MKLPYVVTALSAIALTLQAAPDVELRKGCTAHFASVTEAVAILGQKDDFIARLSPFDRAARLKTDQSVSEEKFLAFVKTSVRPWTNTEETKVQQAIAAIRPALEKVSLKFPAKIFLIKTTGMEEGRAF